MSKTERALLLDRLLAQVRPLVLNSARAVEALWRPDGVSVGMRAVLQILHTEGPLPVPAIAQRLDLARQNVQRHVNELGERDLVRSTANPGHRRSVLIELTGQGQEVFTRLRRAEFERFATLLATDHTDDEIRTATAVLESLNRDVKAQVHA